MSYSRMSLLTVVFLLFWIVSRSVDSAELEVAELVSGIKKSIAEAQKVAQPPFMKIPWMELEITYVVKKEGEGGFKLFVVTAEGKYATETIQRIKYRIEPADEGLIVQTPGEIKKARVAGIDRDAKKIFVNPSGYPEDAVIPLSYGVNTKVSDWAGRMKTMKDVEAGTYGTIEYVKPVEGPPRLDTMVIDERIGDYKKIK